MYDNHRLKTQLVAIVYRLIIICIIFILIENNFIGEDTAKKDNKDKDSKDIIKEALREGRKSTPEPRFAPEKYEPVVKTPPEPTRVKSPDQV